MNVYMLDTDIIIYTIKRRPEAVRKAFNNHTGEMCISAITASELFYGAENSSDISRNMYIVEGLMARVNILDFDITAARQFGRLKRELRGQLIGAYDLMIAAHARSLGLILVTNNIREFGRVPGLQTENWCE